MSAAWDMWFDRAEAEMLERGARGLHVEELRELRRGRYLPKMRAKNGKRFKMRDPNYWHEYRMARIAAGKCPVHSAPLEPGKRCCAKCIEAQAQIRQRARTFNDLAFERVSDPAAMENT